MGIEEIVEKTVIIAVGSDKEKFISAVLFPKDKNLYRRIIRSQK